MPWTLACILVLQIMTSLFKFFFGGSKPIDFPSKMVHVALICHFLVLDPHLKAMGPIYGF
jgi:hypothetical protein